MSSLSKTFHREVEETGQHVTPTAAATQYLRDAHDILSAQPTLRDAVRECITAVIGLSASELDEDASLSIDLGATSLDLLEIAAGLESLSGDVLLVGLMWTGSVSCPFCGDEEGTTRERDASRRVTANIGDPEFNCRSAWHLVALGMLEEHTAKGE